MVLGFSVVYLGIGAWKADNTDMYHKVIILDTGCVTQDLECRWWRPHPLPCHRLRHGNRDGFLHALSSTMKNSSTNVLNVEATFNIWMSFLFLFQIWAWRCVPNLSLFFFFFRSEFFFFFRSKVMFCGY